jgi:hypothetical protein
MPEVILSPKRCVSTSLFLSVYGALQEWFGLSDDIIVLAVMYASVKKLELLQHFQKFYAFEIFKNKSI